jgi:hypothetical protein
MKTADKVIKTKVGLLELGKQLGNVSKACRDQRQESADQRHL